MEMVETHYEEETPKNGAFQDYYADEFAHCYGCGRLNEKGLHIKSYWDGGESVCRFSPAPYYSGGMKNMLYGGMIASLIDCHGAGTAAAAKAREQKIALESGAMPRFVTAALKVRGTVTEIKGRKVIVSVTLSVEQKVCAAGEVILVQIKE